MTRSTGTSGLIFFGVGAEARRGVAHGGEVDDRRNAGEILHQHAGRAEGDLVAGRAAVLEPVGDGADVVGLDGAAVLVAQQVLQQHLQREGQARDAGQAVLLGLLQGEIDVGLAADVERLAAFEAVGMGHGGGSFSDLAVMSERRTALQRAETRPKDAGTTISACPPRCPPVPGEGFMGSALISIHPGRWRGCGLIGKFVTAIKGIRCGAVESGAGRSAAQDSSGGGPVRSQLDGRAADLPCIGDDAAARRAPSVRA